MSENYEKPKLNNHGMLPSAQQFSAHPTDTYGIKTDGGQTVISRNIHRPINAPLHVGKPSTGSSSEGSQTPQTTFHQKPQGQVFTGEGDIKKDPKTGEWKQD